MAMFAKSKSAGWVAVCLYPDRVDVATASWDGARPTLLTLDSYARGSDDVETLKRISRRHGLDRSAVTTLLSGRHYQLLPLEAPNVPKEEMKEAARWQIKDLIDYPVETATLDVLDVPAAPSAAGRPGAILVVAAPNDNVERLMRPFASARAGLKAVDVYEMAQRNIAALCEDKNRGLAMLSFDQDAGYLTFTYHGELHMSRRIDVGLEQLHDAGRQTQLFERVGLEVQRSTDGFERQYSHIPLTQLLLAPSPFAMPLRDFLGDYLSVPIRILDLAQVMDLSAVPALAASEGQGRHFATVGAALRREVSRAEAEPGETEPRVAEVAA